MFYGNPKDYPELDNGSLKFVSKYLWIWFMFFTCFGLVEIYKGTDGVLLKPGTALTFVLMLMSLHHHFWGSVGSEVEGENET